MGIGGVNPEEMMKGLIASRFKIEFAHYRFVRDLTAFIEKTNFYHYFSLFYAVAADSHKHTYFLTYITKHTCQGA